MCEYIINQDLDRAIKFSVNVTMYTIPFLVGGKSCGINLMYGNQLLGSFDTIDDAIQVMSDIMGCENSVFVVQGFEDYDGKDEFWSLMDEQILGGWANA